MPNRIVNKTLPTLVIWFMVDLYLLIMFLSIQPGLFLICLFAAYEVSMVLSIVYERNWSQLTRINNLLWIAMLANLMPRLFAILLIKTDQQNNVLFGWVFRFCKLIAAVPFSGLIILLSRNAKKD